MDFFNIIYNYIIAITPKVFSALLTLVIGWWIVTKIANLIIRFMQRAKIDAALTQFLGSILKIVLKVLLIITAVSMLGVQMTSFIAIIGAAGLAVGLALQGSLANFAGGVLIILFRLYRVGDFIEAQGFMGTVQEIQIFNTVLNTVDNKRIIIPNGQLSNNTITNFTANDIRRVDLRIGVSYSDSIEKVKNVIFRIVDAHPLVFKEPEPLIRVVELGTSSVDFTVRVWCNKDDYWTIYFDLTEQIKIEFDKEGISIPFPQMDISLKKTKE